MHYSLCESGELDLFAYVVLSASLAFAINEIPLPRVSRGIVIDIVGI